MTALLCAACGTAAPADAAQGQTHYRRLSHGLSKAQRTPSGGGKARSCGPWVPADATREQREHAVREWRERDAR